MSPSAPQLCGRATLGASEFESAIFGLRAFRGATRSVMGAIDAAVVAFFQEFLEPPKVPVAPLDNELSNLLRFLGADHRQAFDRSCTKETPDVERLPGFMGENRRRCKPTVEQLSCG